MSKFRSKAFIAVGMLLLPIAASAQAVPDGGGVLEQIVDQFKAASSGWATTMQGFALGLFGLLATISFSYNTIMYALRGEAQLYGWLGHVVKEILRVGFWFAVLLSATSWIPAIIDSLRQAGEAASGVGTLSPTNAISIGINISSAMLQRSAGPSGIAQVVVATLTGDGGAPFAAVLSNFSFQIAAIIIVAIFAYIALQIIIALVEMYFVTSAGVLFIGMGGSPWTADFAVKTLVYAVSVGAKLMVMALILGIGMQVARQWMDLDYTNFSTSVIVIGCAIVLAGVVKMVPELVQGMIQGASVTSAAPMIGAATSMAAAAGAAATAGVGAGMALHSATTMAAGQMSAATAAGGGPTSAGGRAAFMLSNAAKNLASSATQDIGGKLAGSNRHGSMGGRMAAAMNDQMKREEKAPAPNDASGGDRAHRTGGGSSADMAGGDSASGGASADTHSVVISSAVEGGGDAGSGGFATGAGAAAAVPVAPVSHAGGGDAGGRNGGSPSRGTSPGSALQQSGGVVSGGPAGGGPLISGGPGAPLSLPTSSYASPAIDLSSISSDPPPGVSDMPKR